MSLPLLLLAALGCTGPDEASADALGECDDEGSSEVYVIQQLWFVRVADGVVDDGFDLDGDDSSAGGAGGCGVGDYAAVDGTSGIDNAFAGLLPVLELTEAAAVESLVAQAINDGDLLITMSLDELDDPMDDACVDLQLGRAAGVPMLGTDGLLLPGQTFDRDADAPGFITEDQVLRAGEMIAPLELELPLQVFEVQLNFVLTGGQMRVVRHQDGTVGGVFSGAVQTASLLNVLIENDAVLYDGTYDVLASLLSLWADMDPDESGVCQSLSISFGFEAVPAFFFEE